MFTGIIQSIGKLKPKKNILEIEILDSLFDIAKECVEEIFKIQN